MSGWCLLCFPGPYLHQSWEESSSSSKSWFLWEPVTNDNRFICLLSWNVRTWRKKPSTYRNWYTASESRESPFSISKPEWESSPVAQPLYPSASSGSGTALSSIWGTRLKETVSSRFLFERGEEETRQLLPGSCLRPRQHSVGKARRVSSLHLAGARVPVLSHRRDGNSHFYTPCWMLCLTCPSFSVLIHVWPASKEELHFPWLQSLN